MAINVNRTVLDPFYRYKMPRLFAKVEGKGNGIKTVIANMSDIAKALDRLPIYVTKYFGCELGAQTNFDVKNERYIVNGEHDAQKLQEILDGFIRKFVLCPECDNPETVLSVRKNQIHQACKACGYIGIINSKHKLLTFIVRHPPPKIGDSIRKPENGTSNDENSCENNAAEIPVENDGTWASSDEDEGDWHPGPLEEDVDILVTGQMAKLTMNRDLNRTVTERLDMLHEHLVEMKQKTGKLDDERAIVLEAERLDLKNKAPLLLCDVIFDTDVIRQIKQYRTLLLRFVIGDAKAQRHLLGGIEQLIERNSPILLSRTALIVKTLYDEDILEEQVLLDWGAKPSSKYVKKEFAKELISKAEPVLNWLKEAEEESEDDEEFQLEFDDRARQVGTVGIEQKGRQVAKNIEKEEQHDLDIDDI